MKRVALGTVCEINPRDNGSSRLADAAEVSFLPMAGVGEMGTGIIEEQTRLFSEVRKGYTPFQRGDVLIAKITPCFQNGKLAIATTRRAVGYGTTEFHVLRPRDGQLDNRYLFHFLRRPSIHEGGIRRMTGTGGQLRVPSAFFTELLIPLPPLAEQKRIAAVLDKADALRAKRRQALATLDTLLQSVFLDMFGDPMTNPKGWPIERVESLLASGDGRIRTGPFGSQLLHSEFEPEGVPILGIDNVVTNEFRWAEPRCLPSEKYRKFARYRVFPGDVLVTIMGTVGRVCVAPHDLPECMSTKHLCAITLDPSKVLPVFIWASFLHDSSVRAQMRVAGKGAIMEGWNSTTIRQLRVKLPPLKLQREFAAIHERLCATKHSLVAHLEVVDALFASLQSAAFAGTLFDGEASRHAQHAAAARSIGATP